MQLFFADASALPDPRMSPSAHFKTPKRHEVALFMVNIIGVVIRPIEKWYKFP
jgi:hypothetical protein